MGKKKWPRVTAQNINSSRPVPLFSLNEFKRESDYDCGPPPTNSLYPEPNQPSKNDFGSPGGDSFSSGNLPPWQRNRGEFGSKQDHNIDSAPWNRSSRPDSWTTDRPDWNKSQEGPMNPRNSDMSFGRQNQDYGRFMNNEEPSTYRDSRGGSLNENRWNDRPMSNERNEWSKMPLQTNNPRSEFERFSDSNQTRMDESHIDQWPSRSSVSRDQTNRFERSDRTDILRSNEWSDRNQNQPSYSEPRRQQQWECSPQDEWKKRQESSCRDEWNNERQYSENRGMTSQNHSSNWNDERNRNPFRESEWISRQNQGMNDRNWNDSLRNRIDSSWSSDSKNDDSKWSDGPYDRSSSRPSNSLDTMLGNRGQNSNQNLDCFREPSGRVFGRKRERSPVNQNVWSRLEPKSGFIENLLHVKKKLKSIEQQIEKHVSKESELKGPFPTFGGIQNQSIKKGLKSSTPKKNLQSSVQEEQRKSFEVLITPRFKKSRFVPKDKEEIEEKLIKALQSMANSDNVTSFPQLRFVGIKLLTKTVIVVTCHDAETAKWLLWWNLGETRFPVRTILPEDPAQLAIIGFVTKVSCEVSSVEMKLNLKTQNPELDISKWVDGVSTMKKKFKRYIYQVDGHTLRYLVKNKWELFLDMYKLHVTLFKTNFYFNPVTFTRL